MDTIVETPRLRLTLLTDTSPDSQHLKWYHQQWSDPTTTGWSAHGRCKTVEESRELMQQRVTGDNIQYVVHIKSADRPDADTEELEMAGSCGLRYVTMSVSMTMSTCEDDQRLNVHIDQNPRLGPQTTSTRTHSRRETAQLSRAGLRVLREYVGEGICYGSMLCTPRCLS